MPVVTANETYKIRNMQLVQDSAGMYLTLQNASARAFVLCFGRGRAAGADDARRLLTEEDLAELGRGAEFTRGEYRFQGVRRNDFFARPVFRGFRAAPPEQIEVWAMGIDAFDGTCTLYVPDDGKTQIVYVPLRYRASYRMAGPVCTIKAELLDPGEYRTGDLVYRVGQYPPLPVTADMLGQEFRVRLHPGDRVVVIPRAGNEEKMVLAG